MQVVVMKAQTCVHLHTYIHTYVHAYILFNDCMKKFLEPWINYRYLQLVQKTDLHSVVCKHICKACQMLSYWGETMNSKSQKCA